MPQASADAEGNPCGVGNYDPLNDVDFLEKEINNVANGNTL
jgi:hypothetical protein